MIDVTVYGIIVAHFRGFVGDTVGVDEWVREVADNDDLTDVFGKR